MYRPNNCKQCGGKMQAGGIKIDFGNLMNVGPNDLPPIDEEEKDQFVLPKMNRTQEMISKGLLEAPRGYNTPEEWYAAMSGEQKKKKRIDPFMTYLAMQGIETGLGAIGNAVERGRQNQYMYKQLSTLGQANPMPYQDYQPNPYSLYAKYGGSFKKHVKNIEKEYQLGGASMAAFRPSEQDLAKQNIYLQDLARRTGAADWQNVHANQIVPVIDETTGKPFVHPGTTSQNNTYVSKLPVPKGADIQIDPSTFQPYYIDPQTGYINYVDKNKFQFRPSK